MSRHPAPDYAAELAAAERAAREAAALIRHHAGEATAVREKGLHDLVTATDEEAQHIILATLRGAFPDYAVLAEEGDEQERAAGRPRWIIDPIDGTTNFAHGVPPYCVSIALQDETGALVLGVVHEVAADEVFAAVAGRGLTVNGEPAGVSTTAELGQALVTTGFPFREYGHLDAYLAALRRFMLDTRGLRRPGSAAADLAWVAGGRFDAFFEAGLAPWDVAAGVVLVREGRGRVTGLVENDDPVFGPGIAASNAVLHKEVLARTGELGLAAKKNITEV